MRLSQHQIDAFERDGYVIVPGMFEAATMDRVSDWTAEIVTEPEVPGRHMVYYEDSLSQPGRRILSRIENFCPYHARFDALLNGETVLGCMAQLFGEPAVMFKDKINFKRAGADGFKAHQDVQAGWDSYARLHITLLISIDPATVRNGCLEMAPGLHKRGLIGDKWRPLQEADREIDYIHCPTRSGDAVFFDSYTPHRSAPNATAADRRVLYVTYNRASEGDHRARYYADKRLSFPPDCEREPDKEYVFRV